ncbi:hypothetical protein ABTZ21_36550 [Streptomyces sp. NPDC096191]|uniref:hypothetical protein n=1 Tax=Streptomyces sp. NPDC096191 TaxID=3155426 RepID=UPI00332D95E0
MTALLLRRATTVIASCTVAIGMVLAPDADAAPGPAPMAADIAATQECYERDGYPPGGGRNLGGNPPKYNWDFTPHIGARYSSCGRFISLYYGGATNITHYNVRWAAPGENWKQSELRAGAKMVWKFYSVWGDYNFAVQACHRGDRFQKSRCTNWSPQIYLNAR